MNLWIFFRLESHHYGECYDSLIKFDQSSNIYGNIYIKNIQTEPKTDQFPIINHVNESKHALEPLTRQTAYIRLPNRPRQTPFEFAQSKHKNGIRIIQFIEYVHSETNTGV